MHPDVTALLEVQTDDVSIHDLEARLGDLEPRVRALEQEINKAAAALIQARQAVDNEERRQREVQGRVGQHRQLQERNQTQLNSVTSTREATAATAQLEQAKRMIEQDERELEVIGGRLTELRREAEEREREVGGLKEKQVQARATLDADSATIRSELSALLRVRGEKARRVPRPLLSRYERIRSRPSVIAVFPLHGGSCTNCNTTIPLQRRSAMAANGNMEVCEGCGVLLYAE